VQKLTLAGVSNGRVVLSSAEYLLWASCAPGLISEVFINFPDPWPKAAQQHRRLINGQFLALLASRMKPDGRLTIATDHAEYAAVIADSLENTPYFTNLLPTPFVTSDNDRLRTKYELLALNAGHRCHYFKWQRLADVPAALDFAIPQEVPMPHIILHSPLEPEEIARRFTPQEYSEGDVHVRIPMLFQSPSRPLLLLEAYINEEPVSQRIGVLIRQRSDNEYIIGLSEIGFPRPTRGVQLAIGCLGQWLVRQHQDTAVQQHNLPNFLF
jgi:tRNA (guanine-N7-)-methyltransferase